MARSDLNCLLKYEGIHYTKVFSFKQLLPLKMKVVTVMKSDSLLKRNFKLEKLRAFYDESAVQKGERAYCFDLYEPAGNDST